MLHHVYIACLDNVKNGKCFCVCDSVKVKDAIYTDRHTVRNLFNILTAIKRYLVMPTHVVSSSTQMLQAAQFAGQRDEELNHKGNTQIPINRPVNCWKGLSSAHKWANTIMKLNHLLLMFKVNSMTHLPPATAQTQSSRF